MKQLLLVCALFSLACTNPGENPSAPSASQLVGEGKKQHYEGAFTKGMKQTYISFDISPDGKQLQNLTFKGYWRCSGKLTQDILGPEKSFSLKGNKVDGIIVEPEDGGATATRYELHATLNGAKAEGTFRMNINGLGCDTYVLTWTAERK